MLPQSEAEVLLFASDASDGPCGSGGAGACWAGAGGGPLPNAEDPTELINDPGGKY